MELLTMALQRAWGNQSKRHYIVFKNHQRAKEAAYLLPYSLPNLYFCDVNMNVRGIEGEVFFDHWNHKPRDLQRWSTVRNGEEPDNA